MNGIVRALRPYAEGLPGLAGTYRELRERMPNRFGRPQPTPHGFAFAGYPAMQRAEWEPLETRFLLDELARSDVFIDIGANIGYYTCLARAHRAHVIAVEPLETNLRVLYKNVAANGWRDVEVFPVALAESPGIVELFGTNTGASLIPGWGGISSNSRIVPMSTLDTLLGTRFPNARVLVKMDVEGVEHMVLRGATQTLERTPHPTWLVEVCLTEHQSGVNPHFREVFEMFWKRDYRAETLEERREITTADVDEWISTGRRSFGSYSIVFVPR